MTLGAQDIDVTIGEARLLAQVSCSFVPGEVTVILGPNGAGKSTLLDCLAGLRVPTNGTVLLDAGHLSTIDPRERGRRIGYLPQSAELHWDLEVRDLVALGRAPRRGHFGRLSPEDEAAIDKALTATDTARFTGRCAGSLSGGERARVLLARVLAGEPGWILADEPLASLDPAHQIEMLTMLRAVAQGGTGVVLVLHDLMLAGWIADACLILREGEVFAAGRADLLRDAPLLEALYGVPMARIERPDGSVLLVPTPGA